MSSMWRIPQHAIDADQVLSSSIRWCPRTTSIDAGYFSEANVEAVARWAGSSPSRRIARLVRYDAPMWSAGLSMVDQMRRISRTARPRSDRTQVLGLVAQDAAIFLFAFSLIDI